MQLQLKKSIAVLFLLAGWLVTQAAALQHEFSAEHLDSSGHEICLNHAFHLDDFIEANTQDCIVHLLVVSQGKPRLVDREILFSYFNSLQPRAPPVYFL